MKNERELASWLRTLWACLPGNQIGWRQAFTSPSVPLGPTQAKSHPQLYTRTTTKTSPHPISRGLVDTTALLLWTSLSLLSALAQLQQALVTKPQVIPASEASRLTVDLPFSLRAYRWNPMVLPSVLQQTTCYGLPCLPGPILCGSHSSCPPNPSLKK